MSCDDGVVEVKGERKPDVCMELAGCYVDAEYRHDRYGKASSFEYYCILRKNVFFILLYTQR